MIIGHSVSDAEGIILAIDAPVAEAMCKHSRDIEGRSYLTMTHPDDIARNLAQVGALMPNGGSTLIRKRYLAGGGGFVALDVQVSRLGDGRSAGFLVGSFSTIEDGDDPAAPFGLWRRAKDLLAVAEARNAALGHDLFVDHAWMILLCVYVAEAEGGIVTTDALGDRLRLSRTSVPRWVRALQARGLIDEGDPLQLSPQGIATIERLLGAVEPVEPTLS